ncbi:hypothetical protein A9Q81_19065 [Gammaproteobacteria bacterium 42_54_T18]|mgnify:CR=1 FL=1|nr:hypothetical protein A9Q81_19065 [Gammaproteobacteria bacterium 42_54_T18]
MDETLLLPEVKQHYEALPYPPRNPNDEKNRLVKTTGDNLDKLNHYCFNGKRDFSSGFRCLVAGGGTGDAVIYLAEQLRYCNGEVVYLDMSEASRAVAEKRAAIRGLTNITWVTASLLELPSLGLGKFDYINCSGVLHHLESTEQGLQALVDVLQDDGAIFLMLYGRYGRTTVYEMQALLREYLPASADIPEKIEMARKLLDHLPKFNNFKRDLDAGLWGHEMSDDGYGDEGLYDLLLHSRDRCFDVQELYQLIEPTGMFLADFVGRDRRFYDPCNLVSDVQVQRRFKQMKKRQQQSVAEKLCGQFKKHEFYLTRKKNSRSTLNDMDNVMLLVDEMEGQHKILSESMMPPKPITVTYKVKRYEEKINIKGTAITKQLFFYMDGKTPLNRIFKRIKKLIPGTKTSEIKQELSDVFEVFSSRGWLYLRHSGVKKRE